MWIDWFVPALAPLVWVVLGTLGMYATILVFARWSGVRSFAQLSTFDIAVTIAIGSVLATTVAAENPALLQGVAAVVTLYALQLGVSWLRSRSRPIAFAVDNAPILLMAAGGEMLRSNMRVARVSEDDLRAHLRAANCADTASVLAVVMEGTGKINVLHGAGTLDRDDWILEGVRDYTPSTATRAAHEVDATRVPGTVEH